MAYKMAGWSPFTKKHEKKEDKKETETERRSRLVNEAIKKGYVAPITKETLPKYKRFIFQETEV